MAAPVLANAYRSLSDGYEAFQSCRHAFITIIDLVAFTMHACQ